MDELVSRAAYSVEGTGAHGVSSPCETIAFGAFEPVEGRRLPCRGIGHGDAGESEHIVKRPIFEHRHKHMFDWSSTLVNNIRVVCFDISYSCELTYALG